MSLDVRSGFNLAQANRLLVVRKRVKRPGFDYLK